MDDTTRGHRSGTLQLASSTDTELAVALGGSQAGLAPPLPIGKGHCNADAPFASVHIQLMPPGEHKICNTSSDTTRGHE